MSIELVPTWYGAYLVERGRVVEERRFPDDLAERARRLRLRREGALAPEEEALVAESAGRPIVTRDRRFEGTGVEWISERREPLDLRAPGRSELRELLLSDGVASLERAWDPSVHLEEAVRTVEDLDRVRNLVGERLSSWAERDRPELSEGGDGEGDAAAEALLKARGVEAAGGIAGDPSLLDARRSLAESYRDLGTLRRSVEAAVVEATGRSAPNLSSLLGPLLAARMIAKAGGIDHLARLPSSTVQVLGAERAFFDHLRRGTRPPRHGLLFLHPSIQGAPRKQRGRLARALAGKVAIAARIDRAGKPVDASLATAFERRAGEIRSSGKPGGRSRPPLDRAALDG